MPFRYKDYFMIRVFLAHTKIDIDKEKENKLELRDGMKASFTADRQRGNRLSATTVII